MSIAAIRGELFAEQPSGVLYHYTSLAALMQIVETRSLYMTDIRFLSDAAEMQNALLLLLSAVQRRGIAEARLGPQGFQARMESWSPLDEFITWLVLHLSTEAGIYVTSFTPNGNLLSQWRGYCPDNRGVSVGFDAERMRAEVEREGLLIGRCVYDRQRQEEIADSLIDDVAQRLPHVTLRESNYLALARDIETDLLRIAVLLKPSSFREEDEWRVVSPPRADDVDSLIGYREGKSMLIPFRRFALPVTAEGQVDFFTVYLGPTQHAKLSMTSLADYLARAGASPRQGVQYSDIPLRHL
jgi:hypothetical protein